MTLFKEQIQEDIKLIQDEHAELNSKLKQDNFAFNYWILGRIYNIDEELIPEYVVDYSDYGLDCFVHYEDTKELFLIQNKYYDDGTALDRTKVADFLKSPLSELKSGTYKKSKDLQTIFSKAIEDSEYKIYLHFYITNNKKQSPIENLFNTFNIDSKPSDKYKATITSKIYYLDDIQELYYGKTFKEARNFDFNLSTVNKGTILRILPDQYNLSGMSPAHYIMTPVSVIYRMYEAARKKDYALFEENIREYLGKSSVNNRIRATLLDPIEKTNFFYYNNGITIICKNATSTTGSGFQLEIFQPQVVNGCQTVNTIHDVLDDFAKKDDSLVEKEFGNVYVMVKVLVFNDEIKKKKPGFYKDIVKYTNSQNAISEKAFASDKEIFFKLQKELEERGLLLLIQPSDKNTYKTRYKNKADLNRFLLTANKSSANFNITSTTLNDVSVQLEKLLQVYLAFMTDGYHAYTKRSNILNMQSDYYNNYSIKLHENLTYDNIIKLYFFFKKAEIAKNSSDDKKTPIPYYLIGFLGSLVSVKTPDSLSKFFKTLYSNTESIDKVFNYLSDLTNFYKIAYKNKTGEEYNTMIKQKIDVGILNQQMEFLNSMANHKDAKKIIDELKRII